MRMPSEDDITDYVWPPDASARFRTYMATPPDGDDKEARKAFYVAEITRFMRERRQDRDFWTTPEELGRAKDRGPTAEGRRRISEFQKARWARIRARYSVTGSHRCRDMPRQRPE